MNEEERRLEFVSLRNQKALIIELCRGDLGVSRQSEQALNSASKFTLNSSKGQGNEESSSAETDFLSIASGKSQSSEMASSLHSQKRDSTFEGASVTNTVTIYSDSMDMVGACIQSLAGDFLAMA